MSRFETEILAQPEDLAFLMNLTGVCVDTARKGKTPKQIILDSEMINLQVDVRHYAAIVYRRNKGQL